MTNLNQFQTNLFEEMTLSELCSFEIQLDLWKLESYTPLGEIEEDENATDEQLIYVKQESARLNKFFKMIDKTWEKAVELATIREENGHFA
ncbi:UNVERIFIED_CONTAM: hypothetical protein ODR73_25795 [Escherichia coli]